MTDEQTPEQIESAPMGAADESAAPEASADGGGVDAPEPALEPDPTVEIPVVGREAIIDWVDAGSRERAELVLAAQDALPPEERDARMVVDLTAWLEGAVVDEAPVAAGGESVKLPSTSAREQEMYEAELAAWQRDNPGASSAVEAGRSPDDQGAVE